MLHAARECGAHLICVPRDVIDSSREGKIGVLYKQDDPTKPFLESDLDAYPSISEYRKYADAKSAIIAIGAPSLIAGKAAESLAAAGTPTDVFVVNHLPIDADKLSEIMARYPGGITTVEDNKIGNPGRGLRGFAGLVNSYRADGTRLVHIGISDASAYPAGSGDDMWDYFGISQKGIEAAVQGLAGKDVGGG